MSKLPISEVLGQGISIPELGPAARDVAETGGSRFENVLAEKLGEIDALQKDANRMINEMADSKGEGLQDAIVSMEKASLSFEMMMRVRSKILEAYQEVMKMQV